MIILGDVATNKSSIKVDGIDTNSTILLNCEGYLVEDIGANNTVFNNVKLFRDLSKNFNLILNLSNNHTMDVQDGVSKSLKLAIVNNLKTVGAGLNLNGANKPLITAVDGIEIAVISGGWDVIGCKSATKKSEGVAPLDSKRILKQVEKQSLLGRKVVVYLHWGYELEIYPQPTHRKLAKNCVDSGADIVLGCHSHCLQGYEVHKNKYIFYGLGNSVFEEKYYYDGKLTFPDFCKTGLAVEWDAKNGNVRASLSSYKNSTLTISEFNLPERIKELNNLSTFSQLNSSHYVKFFKDNRRKRNLLPIFHEKDTSFKYKLKRNFMSKRATLISTLFKIGLKGSSR